MTSDEWKVHENTSPVDLAVGLGNRVYYTSECFVCGKEEEHDVEELSDDNEVSVTHDMIAAGWREVTWGDTRGAACPKCVKEGPPDA